MISIAFQRVEAFCCKLVPTNASGRVLGYRFQRFCSLTSNGIDVDGCHRSSRLLACRLCGVLGQRSAGKCLQECLITHNSNMLMPLAAQIRCYYKHNRPKRHDYNKPNDFSEETLKKTALKRRLEFRKSKLQEQLELGQIKIPGPRVVTSLPPKRKLTGRESFITLSVENNTFGKFSDLIAMVAISSHEEFVQICKPTKPLLARIEMLTGLYYDVNKDEVLLNGKHVDTVEPQKAVQNLLEFVKQYDNPMFVMFDSKRKTHSRLDVLLDKYNLYDEIVSAVPHFIDVREVARSNRPNTAVKNNGLPSLCLKCLGLQLKDGDLLESTRGLHRLFTECLLHTRCEQFVRYMDERRAEYSYLQMFLNCDINVVAMDKLALAGISLDHLKFLTTRGFDEFRAELLDVGAFKFDEDYEDLFIFLTQSMN